MRTLGSRRFEVCMGLENHSNTHSNTNTGTDTNVWSCFWVAASLRTVRVFSWQNLWMEVVWIVRCGQEEEEKMYRRHGHNVFKSCLMSWMLSVIFISTTRAFIRLEVKILLEKIVHNEDAARADQSVTHRAKLADFGLTRIFIKNKKRIGETQETKKSSKDAIRAANWISMKRKGFVGTPRWMAPEMMKSEVEIGPSVDIYSFGVVMWEVWSGRN